MKTNHTKNRTERRRSTPSHVATSLLPLACATMVFVFLAAAEPPDRLADAIDAQRAATVDDPTNATLFSDLGNLLALDGRTDEAEAAYERALELAPDHPEVLYNLALLQQAAGRTQEALEHFKRSAQANPDSAWTHFQIASLLRERGRRQDAIAAYTEAFSLDPTLAFSDTNPQMIGNDEATTALLRVQASVKRSAAPRTYFDGERIRSLLVRTPNPESSNGSETEPELEEPGLMEEVDESSAATINAQTDVGSASQSAETLTAESYDDEADFDELEELDEIDTEAFDAADDFADEEARARASQSPRPVRSVGRQDLGGTAVNQSLSGGASQQPAGGSRSQMNRGRGRPSSNSVNTPTTRFRPGRRSSARLNRQLLPATPTAEPSQGATTSLAGD